MKNETVHPATADDYAAIYGTPPAVSFFGAAVRHDGRTVAVAGVYVSNGLPVVFSQISEPVRKRTILRVAYAILRRARQKGLPLFAIRDPNLPTSDGFIQHFGFVPAGRTEAGEVYAWLS